MADSISFGASAWTERNDDRSFPEWHRGQPWYYFWSVMIEDTGWVQNAKRSAQHLSDYLVAGYQRQPHVTLLPAGFAAALSLDSGKLVDIARDVDPFDITLGTLTSFTSSPCFTVMDSSGTLRALRSKLRHIMIDPDGVVANAEYQPHLTAGLYRDRFPAEDLCRMIADFRAEATNMVRIREFSLARYHTESIKGPIEVVANVALQSGCFTQICDAEVFA